METPVELHSMVKENKLLVEPKKTKQFIFQYRDEKNPTKM